MPAPAIELHAQAIADRVSPRVGFDPATILTIITTILPMLMQCFNRNDEADPQAVRAAVRKQNERNPKQLRRRTAARIRRESATRMTQEQALELADSTIEECLESDDDTVAEFSLACRAA